MIEGNQRGGGLWRDLPLRSKKPLTGNKGFHRWVLVAFPNRSKPTIAPGKAFANVAKKGGLVSGRLPIN